MKRQRENTSFRYNIMIYHHEIDTNGINGTTFWLITEIAVSGEPLRTYSYRIPDSYKDDSLLGELPVCYGQYCPN